MDLAGVYRKVHPMSSEQKDPLSGRPGNRSMGYWITIGLAVGAGIGVALDNLAIGVGIGLAVGLALGAAQASRNKNK